MPRGDGTGPSGEGMRTGKSMGQRSGRGPGGYCVCPACNVQVPHQPGTPCTLVECPKCGTKMVRA